MRELGKAAAALDARACARSGSGRSGSCRGTRRRAVRQLALEPAESSPSSSIGTPTTSAPSRARILSGRSYVGASTSTRVPAPDELLGEEDEALERAARDHDHARRLDAVPLGEPLAQRPVAAARAVGEDRPAVALDRGARAVGELLDGKALGRGHSARERDHIHGVSLTAPAGSVPSTTASARRPAARPRSASCRPAIPRASSASFFACAVPEEPEMIAPAWPIVLPGGAEKPAMYASTGFVTCSAT